MKITIYKETKKPRTIKITNKLFINRIFANYIYKKRKKENKLISKKQIILILKIAKKNTKEYKGWKLLEIESNDNEQIDIII